MRAFISQPMRGKTDEEILTERNRVKEYLKALGYYVVDSFFKDNVRVLNKPLYSLAESLKLLSTCDAVYFCNGWMDARGCKIEHICAQEYGVKILDPIKETKYV